MIDARVGGNYVRVVDATQEHHDERLVSDGQLLPVRNNLD